MPHYLQRAVSSPTVAIYVGLSITAALCASARRGSRNFLSEQQSTWILDICDELWNYLQRWTTSSDEWPLHDETIAIYMQLMEVLAVPDPEANEYCPSLLKATLTAVSSLASLVRALDTSPMSDSNQTQLALLLTRFCHLAQPEERQSNVLDRRRNPLQVLDTDALRQSAQMVCENTELLSGLEKDLQVCGTRN